MNTNKNRRYKMSDELGTGNLTLQPPKAKRKSRKLTWNERQYGAGFLNGLWCGIALGFPLAAGVAALCKVFVGWLMAW